MEHGLLILFLFNINSRNNMKNVLKAIEQVNRYKSSNLFKDRTDVRYLVVVFIGKKKYWIEEH